MTEPGTIIEIIASLPALGFVMWLVHRFSTHTIPRLAKDNAERQTQQRADFLESQRISREDFRAILKDQRDSFCAELERERAFHGERVDALIRAANGKGLHA